MTQLPETIHWIAVGSTPYRSKGPDGEEVLPTFLTHVEAFQFWMDIEPFDNSALLVHPVLTSRAYDYAKDSGTKMLLGLDVVFDPELLIH